MKIHPISYIKQIKNRMNHRCLSRDEYKIVIDYLLYSQCIESEELNELIQSATDYWDVNIIGSNYFLSIILEQIIKCKTINKDIIHEVYELENKMYFTIDEMDYKFIDELFKYHLPNNRNTLTEQLKRATTGSNIEQVAQLEERISQSFEEDLHDILKCFYETKVRY